MRATLVTLAIAFSACGSSTSSSSPSATVLPMPPGVYVGAVRGGDNAWHDAWLRAEWPETNQPDAMLLVIAVDWLASRRGLVPDFYETGSMAFATRVGPTISARFGNVSLAWDVDYSDPSGPALVEPTIEPLNFLESRFTLLRPIGPP